MKKKTLLVIVSLLLTVSMTGCGLFRNLFRTDRPSTGQTNVSSGSWRDDAADPQDPYQGQNGYQDGQSGTEAADVDYQSGSWVIYWYICGSDLETEQGQATMDLREMLDVSLPENVSVVIQTGGAGYWWNDVVSPSSIQRYVYNSRDLYLVDEEPMANMGDAETLADFLRFATTYYPADHEALIFWNHGGGTIGGAEYDENYYYDSLMLDEMYSALQSTLPLSEADPPLDLICFDACLMASVDVAYTLCDAAHYLVASEELESGYGYSYDGILSALAQNPYMSPQELGVTICQTFEQANSYAGDEYSAYNTLSCTDLTQIRPLMEAVEHYGAEVLNAGFGDYANLAEFARCAMECENYGGNNDEDGYADLVDLGDLAEHSGNIVTSSAVSAVLEALNQCVVYQVKGMYRASAHGLSCFFPYDFDSFSVSTFEEQGCSPVLKYLYRYLMTGEVTQDAYDYVTSLIGTSQQSAEYRTIETELPTIESMGWDDTQIYYDDEYNSYIDLGPDASSVLSSVCFELWYGDPDYDLMMYLGTDDNLSFNWADGIFTDQFYGSWGHLDGFPVFMELSYASSEYNVYTVPILLNGEEYNLLVVYDFENNVWMIMGARRSISDEGMADKDLRQLEVGDEVTILWYYTTLSGVEDLQEFEAEVITVTENTEFTYETLFDGLYGIMYDYTDLQGNTGLSQVAMFEIENGEIYTLDA